jgi:cell wall-associated NlpC family hydrolase
MPFYRVTALFLLIFSAVFSSACCAAPSSGFDRADASLKFSPARLLDAAAPRVSDAQPRPNAFFTTTAIPAAVDTVQTQPPATAEPASAGTHLRQLLADFSMTLRNIRYRRGGSEPATGFDCSGFVRYVFRHAADSELPHDSVGQYLAGTKVDPSDLRAGDLVFFHTRGKRVSHVGIYLGNGEFIHSPSTGKRVSVNRLNEAYWSHRFVGAKRPNVLS